jgi:hypothetical protein
MIDECSHEAAIRDVTPSALGCEECLKIGSPWVHLRLAHPLATEIAGHQADQRRLPVQPLRHCLQLAADLVLRKHLEYSGLDGALLTHCRLRR